MKKIRI